MIDAVNSLSSLTGSSAVGRIAQNAAASGVAPSGATSLADFGRVFADVAGEGMETLRRAEAASIAGLNNEASVQQVVEAVMAAERTLQTAIAMRDKVVQAYQEISRMAI